MNQRTGVSGALQIVAAGVLWGTVGPAQVVSGSTTSPATLGAARILLGGLVLATFVLVTRRRDVRSLSPTSVPQLLAASIATGTFQVSFLTAVDRTGAAVATAVVFGLAPVTTGLVERIVLGTRLTRRWSVCTVVAIIGCALLTWPGTTNHVDVVGILLGVVAASCFATYTVAAKQLTSRGVSMPAAVAATLLIGGTILLPWAAAGVSDLADIRTAAVVGWLGMATTAAAYMFYVTGLRRVTAATAGTLSLAEPLVAAVLAFVVLDERLSSVAAVGAILLLGGLIVVSLARRPENTARNGLDRDRSDLIASAS